jgi:O-succinylbenzoate synthase
MDFLKIKSVDLYSYEIPLIFPLIIRNHTISKRNGYIVKLTTHSGLSGYGDIAPLPGLHTEMWDEIPDALKNITRYLLEHTFGWDLAFSEIDSTDYNIPTSLKFGLESAILNLIDLQMKNSDMNYYFSDLVEKIEINALIDPTERPVEQAFSEKISRGFSCIKVKTGRQSLEADIRMVKRLYEIAGESVLLRIDSNRSWSLGDALQFCNGVPSRAIEYLEEPLRDPYELPKLFQLTYFPLAVDESLEENKPESLLNEKWVSAAVVKPAVIGGIFRTFKLLHQADKLQKKVIISDTYHSGIGVSMLTRIAAIRREKITAAGLDTYSRLKEDILQERLSIEGGVVHLNDVQRKSQNLNFGVLRYHEFY